MTKTITRCKKAISPILATLLLIVIAVAAIVVTYAWIMTYMSSTTQQAGVFLFRGNVSWNSTASKTTIEIGNSGTSETKIIKLYIGNSENNVIDVTSYTDLGEGKPLGAKSVTSFTLDWPNALSNSFTAGNMYYFKVLAEGGQQLGPFLQEATSL